MKRFSPHPDPRGGLDTKESGFTLIELSIVLVIIGLIVGGILVGQTVIANAQIRSALTQITQLNTSVNSFRDKYGYLPGDMPQAKATAAGMATGTGANPGDGDGNGLIEGYGGSGATVGIGETLLFWRQLSDAGFFGGTTLGVSGNAKLTFPAAGTTVTGSLTATTVPLMFLPSKAANNTFIAVYSANNTNYYELTGITALTITTGAYTLTQPLTPSQASSIDAKIDDGVPNTGNVLADYDPATIGKTVTGAAGKCALTAATYDTVANPNAAECQLSIAFNVN